MTINDINLEYAKAHKEEIIQMLIQDKTPSLTENDRDAIFMAGSPGAGKTEVALGLADHYDNHVIIDADEFRKMFPNYNGTNSSDFQKASSWLVEQAFKYVLENGYSFILDATFAILSAEKNIIRAEKYGFGVTIVYVYQEPQIAWQFTKERELSEGRQVPKHVFINAYYQSRANIEKVKARHPQTVLHIIVKDYRNNIAEVHYAADNIELVLPERYPRERLEEMLND